jgi:hypothetical protein
VENKYWIPNYDNYGRQIGRPHTQEKLYDVESEHLGIHLTEKGRQEAVNWKETDEPYLSAHSYEGTVPWWRIPIGDREIVRIESAQPGPADGGREKILITFRWRWRPNRLGENFDTQSPAYQLMSNATQQSAATLKWDSRTEYVGSATLLKRPDKWDVTKISFANEDTGKFLPDF